MEDGFVCNLFLCSNSRYFAYEQHYNEKRKVIVLKHERNIKDSSSKLDLIAEFNTINKTMENRRLDILLPYFDGFWYETGTQPGIFPSDSFVQEFNYYIDFMELFKDLKEVYIYNLLPYYKTLPYPSVTGEFIDHLFIKMVKSVVKMLPRLNSLFIQGFDEFPEELISLLKSRSLKKFGAMGYCGRVDYEVIHRLFIDDSALKNSITHFIGHCRAVKLFCLITGKSVLEEATVFDRLLGVHGDLTVKTREYTENIKHLFANDDLNKELLLTEPISIGTVYYMEPAILMMHNTMRAEKLKTPYYELIEKSSTVISAEEFLTKCTIQHLVVRLGKYGDFAADITKYALNNFTTIKTIEIIRNSNVSTFDGKLVRKGPSHWNSDLCIILNIDAYSDMWLYGTAEDKLSGGTDSTFYKSFIASVITGDKSNVNLKVKVRRLESEKMDTTSAKHKFIEFCKNKHFNNNSTQF
ncbi:hypothetical protein ENBRE01_2418, partial [Enteropsectra breve]